MRIDYIHEQGTGALNEDAFFVNGSLFGVFDGATSLDDVTYDKGITGGYLASNIAKDTFMQDGAPLTALADQANRNLWKEMVAKGVDVTRKESLWCTSAAVIRVNGDRFEWVQTGDSLILAIYDDGSHKLLVEDYDHDRQTLLMWRKMAPTCEGTIRDELMDQILKVRAGMNVTYGVINGEREALDFLRSGAEPLEGIRHLLMFTDGLFLPSEDPGQPDDIDRFVAIFNESGLSGLRDHVRTLQETDPECRRFPRFKAHDDIAAISLSL